MVFDGILRLIFENPNTVKYPGCKGFPAVSNVFRYGCQELRWVFICIVNRNDFYSQYPVFDGSDGISWYSQIYQSVSIWFPMGIAIPLNTVKYHQILYGNQPLKSHLVISCAPRPIPTPLKYSVSDIIISKFWTFKFKHFKGCQLEP